MKKLSAIYIIAAVLVVMLAVLQFLHIYEGFSFSFIIVSFVSFYQMEYIKKQDKRIKELENH